MQKRKHNIKGLKSIRKELRNSLTRQKLFYGIICNGKNLKEENLEDNIV